MSKMNPEVKAKWIAALRSGEYTQGRELLRNSKNEFCCLGVLCNLHAQAHPDIAARQTSAVGYMGCSGYYPAAVAEWADLPPAQLMARVPRISQHAANIASLNDHGATFAELADAIEGQL